MKPAPFKYLGAETLDEAVSALGEHGEEARILAGGQSLVPLMNMRLALPGVLVDVNRVTELRGISTNGTLGIGAMTRQLTVERSAEARAAAPLLVEALRHVGFPSVRGRGTVGGSVAHADPAAEIPAVLLALGGDVLARGPSGERTIAADDLLAGSFSTTLAADEVITRVRFPRHAADRRTGFAEVARKAHNFALVGCAAAVTVDGSGSVRAARVVLFGVADRAVRSTGAEQALAGRSLGDAGAREEAGSAAASEIDAKNDAQASAAYRKEVTSVMVRRALGQAAAGEGGSR